ncbi:MAG: hypothetical protein U0793_32385 [Gemmataceae bacterium]
MDSTNRFHTKETWLWVRAEHLALIGVLLTLLFLHREEVRWLPFVSAFVSLDLIGYIPGAIAYRGKADGPIAPIYHHLYNLTHSYLTAGVVVAAWALCIGGFEWAMLALPIHLSGDRGLFGNTYKPVSLPFEPGGRAAKEIEANPVALSRGAP